VSNLTFWATTKTQDRYDCEVEYPIYRQYQKSGEFYDIDVYECMTETRTISVSFRSHHIDGDSYEIKSVPHDSGHPVFDNGVDFVLGRGSYALESTVFDHWFNTATTHFRDSIK
jgi:hypothetical protein